MDNHAKINVELVSLSEVTYMEVRHAKESDWLMVKDLLLLMGDMDDAEAAKERFLSCIDNEQHFIPVAVTTKTVVGYGWAQDCGFHLRTGEKTSKLHDLFVHPEYRHNGIATSLFSAIKEWADNNETSGLQWNASPSATKFYKKAGINPLMEEEYYRAFELKYTRLKLKLTQS